MTATIDLLADLQRRGVRLRREPSDGLRVTGLDTAANADVVDALRQRKAELLALLGGGGSTGWALYRAVLERMWSRLNAFRPGGWLEPFHELRQRCPELWLPVDDAEGELEAAARRVVAGDRNATDVLLAAAERSFEAWAAIGRCAEERAVRGAA